MRLKTIVSGFASLVPEAIRVARPHHWADARDWLMFVLIGGCLPFWGVAFLFLLFSQHYSIDHLVGRGELAVFSAGILASAIPIVTRRVRQPTLDHPRWSIAACVALLLLCALTLSAVTLAESFAPALKPNPLVLAVVSLILLTSSLAIGFFAELVSSIRSDPNYQVIGDEGEKALRDRFARALEDGNDHS